VKYIAVTACMMVRGRPFGSSCTTPNVFDLAFLVAATSTNRSVAWGGKGREKGKGKREGGKGKGKRGINNVGSGHEVT